MNISVTASAVLTFALLFSGCHRREQNLNPSPVENNELTFLTVSCRFGSDLPKTKYFFLTIKNPSSRNLDEVTIRVNDSYSISLSNIEIYRGFWKGNQPLGRNRILAGEEIVILSSHDIPNHYVMKDEAGNPMPGSMIPRKLTILTKQGTGSWNFGVDKES